MFPVTSDFRVHFMFTELISTLKKKKKKSIMQKLRQRSSLIFIFHLSPRGGLICSYSKSESFLCGFSSSLFSLTLQRIHAEEVQEQF